MPRRNGGGASAARGNLPEEALGARDLAHLGRNDCERLRTLTALKVSTATAATEVYGSTVREGMSPFALLAGNTFDRLLYENGGARLLQTYRGAGRLTIAECRVVNVAEMIPTASDGSHIAARETLTRRLLLAKLRGDVDAPNLIIKGRLSLQLGTQSYGLEPDHLVAADADLFYRVGEAKSYSDRDGKTDDSKISSALSQAAISTLALRGFVGIARAGAALRYRLEELVPSRADLILHRPGSFSKITLRDQDIRRELFVAAEALRRLTETVDAINRGALAAPLDTAAELNAIPASYCEKCLEFCSMAQECRRQAHAAGDLALLGRRVRETLHAAGSIPRALDLMTGRGRPPATTEESSLLDDLQRVVLEVRRAI